MKEVRQDIKNALSTVTAFNAPMVYDAIQTEVGYKNIEDLIINMMIDENMTASACIPHIEEML
jgi:hypothetical protein